MINFQSAVREFHALMGVAPGKTPAFRDVEFRADLIAEEAIETIVALVGSARAREAVNRAFARCRFTEPDLAEAVDGIADTHYVLSGTSDVLGVDEGPVFALVHAANLAKLGGGRDASGKIQKPDGWAPPDVAGEIERQRAATHAAMLRQSRLLAE